MILSEKEIERLIFSLVGVRLQYATDEPPEPEEWPIATIFNMDKAAHAIAKKLAEGVVWSAIGKPIGTDDTRAIVIEAEGEDWELWIGESRSIIEDAVEKGAKSFTVTVTKEEGDEREGD